MPVGNERAALTHFQLSSPAAGTAIFDAALLQYRSAPAQRRPGCCGNLMPPEW